MLDLITWPVAFAAVSALAIVAQAIIKIFEGREHNPKDLDNVRTMMSKNSADINKANEKLVQLEITLKQLLDEKEEYKKQLLHYEEEYHKIFEKLEKKIEKVSDLIIDILRSSQQ